MIKLEIIGKPIAKKRPKFARRGRHVCTYSDQKTDEGRFLLQCMDVFHDKAPMEGALEVNMIFVFERPKSHFGTGRNEGVLKKTAPKFHTKKPDIDNLEKFAADCLNKLAWKDDSQIIISKTMKLYGQVAKTKIEIKQIKEEKYG